MDLPQAIPIVREIAACDRSIAAAFQERPSRLGVAQEATRQAEAVETVLKELERRQSALDAVEARIAELEASQSTDATFPNPLQVCFGDGRLLILTFMDRDGSGSGLAFRDTGTEHEVGSDAHEPPCENWEPIPGEVYLRFKNRESAVVVRDCLNEVIAKAWPSGVSDANAAEKVEAELAAARRDREAMEWLRKQDNASVRCRDGLYIIWSCGDEAVGTDPSDAILAAKRAAEASER